MIRSITTTAPIAALMMAFTFVPAVAKAGGGNCCQGAGWCASNAGFDAADLTACTDAGGALVSSTDCNVITATCEFLNPAVNAICSNDAPKAVCEEIVFNSLCVDAACQAGCLEGACSATCDSPLADLALINIEEEDNFVPKMELALVQAGNKINQFQEGVRDILSKLDPAPTTIKIGSVQDAITAINTAFTGAGNTPVNVVIFGHGSPGSFKIGEDDLADPAIQDKFLTAVTGKMATLTLFGCSVSQGTDGQAFLKKLTAALGIEVKTWTGTVYAFGNKAEIPEDFQNKFFVDSLDDKKEIPTVSEWGLVAMGLLVLAAGTIVMMRRRTAVA